ncbi:hypothetical protein FJV46_02955 [Arthrobacter agilis]|uniref:hypothetical protein n=1 Tax=Arthrobacter agilis TaxID=37921 RepID=UPI000B356326|nr:hypothetical protein [Arthrobacter agilis]OUM41610.1 hypothetical protein B8W74_12090 [Arthrobacter agilis]PPB47222.1 hypothetical protein CI784_02645 [Arthrobacter agilis]TPV26814.1 hypothetical protein FJV46_02955 [Arthrobacter agilis]WDF32716.1 hypothetical protein PTW37_12735 [Arthrobacter agilis]VDR33075.1 Uncharacterised protein [Arthrobacter agilis]
MLNTPWETGSDLYRKLVISALVTTALGILVAVVGAVTDQRTLVFTAIPIIVAGMVCHLAGMVVRSRDMRRRLKARR